MTVVMTPVDIWAAAAALVCAASLSWRRQMLRPTIAAWASAPGLVQFGIGLLGLVMATVFISICCGSHATVREALVYSVLATTSGLLAWNLYRQGPARDDIAAQLHGRVGIVTTLEMRRDPADLAAWARGKARRRP